MTNLIKSLLHLLVLLCVLATIAGFVYCCYIVFFEKLFVYAFFNIIYCFFFMCLALLACRIL